DDYATAEQVVKLAKTAARVAKDRARAEQVAMRAKDVAELSREFKKLADFRRRVDETPGDPEANLAVGLYDCVFKRD
ncbi:MAG TPA: hypothetical protein VGX76_25080, partial [Pirellulales bacterium]|nr:hypothetical protein [Pirellulales bacterium]